MHLVLILVIGEFALAVPFLLCPVWRLLAAGGGGSGGGGGSAMRRRSSSCRDALVQ